MTSKPIASITRDDLDAITRFLPMFVADGFVFARQTGGDTGADALKDLAGSADHRRPGCLPNCCEQRARDGRLRLRGVGHHQYGQGVGLAMR